MTPPTRGKTTVSPLVLVDGGDDGLDQEGWVEKIVTEREALRLMRHYNPDPELCVIALEGTQFLRPEDPERPDDGQRWLPCNADAEGAREFWWLMAADRDGAGA